MIIYTLRQIAIEKLNVKKYTLVPIYNYNLCIIIVLIIYDNQLYLATEIDLMHEK